jgi:hypothetical protein
MIMNTLSLTLTHTHTRTHTQDHSVTHVADGKAYSRETVEQTARLDGLMNMHDDYFPVHPDGTVCVDVCGYVWICIYMTVCVCERENVCVCVCMCCYCTSFRVCWDIYQ